MEKITNKEIYVISESSIMLCSTVKALLITFFILIFDHKFPLKLHTAQNKHRKIPKSYR